MYYKKHSNTFKIWMIIVEIIFFIAAIVAGATFKTSSGYYYREEHFNWLLALTIWGSNLPLLALLYAVYSILDNQETQIHISNKILEHLQDNTSSSSPVARTTQTSVATPVTTVATTAQQSVTRSASPAPPTVSQTPTPSPTTESNKTQFWICPKCGDKNGWHTKGCACGYYRL